MKYYTDNTRIFNKLINKIITDNLYINIYLINILIW